GAWPAPASAAENDARGRSIGLTASAPATRKTGALTAAKSQSMSTRPCKRYAGSANASAISGSVGRRAPRTSVSTATRKRTRPTALVPPRARVQASDEADRRRGHDHERRRGPADGGDRLGRRDPRQRDRDGGADDERRAEEQALVHPCRVGRAVARHAREREREADHPCRRHAGRDESGEPLQPEAGD